MSQEIRNQVALLTGHAGVKFKAIYKGEKKNALGGTHPMDKWSCAFHKGEAFEEFDFYTGLGHRKPDESALAKMSARSLAKVSKRMLVWENHYKTFPDKPVAPHEADVLYSLILDSSAVGQSFASWCDELGYDSASRKAESIYRACQENADKLAWFFSRAEIAALSEALQDY